MSTVRKIINAHLWGSAKDPTSARLVCSSNDSATARAYMKAVTDAVIQTLNSDWDKKDQLLSNDFRLRAQSKLQEQQGQQDQGQQDQGQQDQGQQGQIDYDAKIKKLEADQRTLINEAFAKAFGQKADDDDECTDIVERTVRDDIYTAKKLGFRLEHKTSRILSVVNSLSLNQGSGRVKLRIIQKTGVNANETSSNRAKGRKSKRLRNLNIIDGRNVASMKQSHVKFRIVIDKSGSMEEGLMSPYQQRLTRLEYALGIASAMYLNLSQKEKDDLEIYAYNNNVRKLDSFTDIQDLKPWGATRIKGLIPILNASKRNERFLVLTDGEIPDISSLEGQGQIAMMYIGDEGIESELAVNWDGSEDSLRECERELKRLLK